MQRLVPSRSLVAVIDVQERLAAVMPEERMAGLLQKTLVLLAAAKLLAVPVVATEQYPKGLGPTVPALAEKLADVGAHRVEKMSFSALDVSELAVHVHDLGASAAIVVGMESHICVYQTVRDLVRRGLEVHVPVDAVVSRREEDRAAGIALCERAGAIPTTVEAVIFDWLERAGTDSFRAIAKLLR
jgi:nicotinamidase-related amidase